jgi:hypothetical protein
MPPLGPSTIDHEQAGNPAGAPAGGILESWNRTGVDAYSLAFRRMEPGALPPRKEPHMLRKSVIALVLVTASVALALAQAPAAAPASAPAKPAAGMPSVDQLIARSVEARGGMEKMKAVQSIRMTGKMTMGQGMEAPLMFERKRPKLMRMEFTVQGMTGIRAYDGKTGWQLMPFGGKKDPEPMSVEDLQEADEEADIDGPLVDYKAKGYTVELIDKEKVEGSDAYKIKVNMKNGSVSYIYLDADTMLEIKNEGKRTIRGSEIEFESTFGDYKEVGGLLFPFSIQNGAKGHPEKQNIIVDTIELNPSLDEARYRMPAAAAPEAPKAEAPKADDPKAAPGKPGSTN